MFTHRADTNKAAIVTPSSSRVAGVPGAAGPPLALVVLWIAGVVLEGLML